MIDDQFLQESGDKTTCRDHPSLLESLEDSYNDDSCCEICDVKASCGRVVIKGTLVAMAKYSSLLST
jgi:hypothetical protein